MLYKYSTNARDKEKNNTCGIKKIHMHTHTHTYMHTYIHIYIYIYIEKERERERLNSIRMGCKTHVLHHSISDCHIGILLKIQYILSYLITSQYIPNLVGFIYGY